MFQAKCKLCYRSRNTKPTHKNVTEDGDMKKLSRYLIQQNDGNTTACRLRFGRLKITAIRVVQFKNRSLNNVGLGQRFSKKREK